MMRKALDNNKLKTAYHNVAKHDDFQHSFLTATSDQRGRKLLVEMTVSTEDNSTG